MRSKVKTAPKEPKVKTQEPEAEGTCRHYWIIESPHGPTSEGVCKFCGAVKEFYNSPPDFWFGKRHEFSFGKRHPEGFEAPDSTPGEADTEEDKSDITPESSADTQKRASNARVGHGDSSRE